VRFLNPHAVIVEGIFRYPKHHPLIIDEHSATIGGLTLSGGCNIDVWGGIRIDSPQADESASAKQPGTPPVPQPTRLVIEIKTPLAYEFQDYDRDVSLGTVINMEVWIESSGEP